MAGYVERGFRAVKIRVGRLKLRDDVRRVAAVRAAIGDDVDLMVDANQAYRSSAEAIAAGRAFAEQGVRWLEEPLGPEHLAATADVAAALDLPIAGGEVESTRWAFRDIIERKALDILQPDVTVVGGISEWLKVAAVAATWSLPVAPHYFFEVHAHLVAATPSALCVEYFYPDADIISFDPLLAEPLVPRSGLLHIGERPGIGLELDEAMLTRSPRRVVVATDHHGLQGRGGRLRASLDAGQARSCVPGAHPPIDVGAAWIDLWIHRIVA